jgi:hypothetical protein
MTDKKIPGRMLVTQIEQHQRWLFRCDDRAGFMLSILWAGDGDLHISIEPDPDHKDRELHCMRMSGSVRLRTPFIGGGSYEHLHAGLINAMRKELTEEKRRERRCRNMDQTGTGQTDLMDQIGKT